MKKTNTLNTAAGISLSPAEIYIIIKAILILIRKGLGEKAACEAVAKQMGISASAAMNIFRNN